MSNDAEFKKNVQAFRDKLGGFLKDPIYRHKFVVIYNQEVKGIYDTFSAALEFAVAEFPQNGFAIQQVLKEDEQIRFLAPVA